VAAARWREDARIGAEQVDGVGCADTQVPGYEQLLWPALHAARGLGGSGSIAEPDEKAVEIAGLTQEQHRVLHGDGPRTEVQ
jgi:hypothetical protein